MATQKQKTSRAAQWKGAAGAIILFIVLLGPQLLIEWLS